MRDSTKSDRNAGVSRRKVLECMTWAGTGVLWTISGGVPLSVGIIDGALAAEPSKLTFLQISDSHIGFDKPGDLPVQQAIKIELVINLQTAQALGVEMPLSLLLRINEVIE